MGNRICYKLVFLLLLGIILLSCNDLGDCLQGTGEIITEERWPGEYRYLTIDDDINAVLQQDTVDRFYIEAGENLLPDITSEVNYDILMVQNNNICKYTRSYEKEITAKVHFIDLDVITHVGSARITSANTLHFDEFFIWLDGARGEVLLNLDADLLTIGNNSGNGYVYLTGEARECNITSESLGRLNLQDLKVSKMKLSANSVNDCYVWATDTLIVDINSLGNVYYRGDPETIVLKKKGKGNLIELLE